MTHFFILVSRGGKRRRGGGGEWSARLESLAGSALIVQIYNLAGGVPILESSSKLRAVGDMSTAFSVMPNIRYEAAFTPYGKSGQSVLTEHFLVNEPPVACFGYSPAM